MSSTQTPNQYNMPNDTSYQDEDTLRELYHDREMDMRQIADEFGIGKSTVNKWMKRHGIESRTSGEGQIIKNRKNPVPYRTDKRGYEYWQLRTKKDRGHFYVHRLAAVAWHGTDAVKDNHIHHKIPVGWLNTEDNLEVLSPEKHLQQHHQKLDPEDYIEMRGMYERGEMNTVELAEHYGVDNSVVSRTVRGESNVHPSLDCKKCGNT